jgi:flagellar hook-basal body complex protein FliE
MDMKIAQAAQAYANAGKVGGPGMAARDQGGGFADLLRQATEDAVGAMKQGETASLQAAAGKANLTEVVTAVSNAEATLQTVAALRDKVISAYQEILRMPI